MRSMTDKIIELSRAVVTAPAYGLECLEVDLAPCGEGGVGGCRHGVSDWFD